MTDSTAPEAAPATATPAPALLIVATVAGTIAGFLAPYAAHFRSLGWRVDAAANGATSDPRLLEAFDRVHELPLSRSLRDVRGLERGRRALAEILETSPDIVHVHTPIASFLTRIAVRQLPRDRRPAVAYTAHGFHFHAARPRNQQRRVPHGRARCRALDGQARRDQRRGRGSGKAPPHRAEPAARSDAGHRPRHGVLRAGGRAGGRPRAGPCTARDSRRCTAVRHRRRAQSEQASGGCDRGPGRNASPGHAPGAGRPRRRPAGRWRPSRATSAPRTASTSWATSRTSGRWSGPRRPWCCPASARASHGRSWRRWPSRCRSSRPRPAATASWSGTTPGSSSRRGTSAGSRRRWTG